MTTYYEDVFGYIHEQEASYTRAVRISDSWSWNMKDHINLTVLYKNSQLKNGKGEFTPVKNITRPILNLQYRAEGFDVKDITIFVNEANAEHISFLVKKFHEKWALENAMDTFIDTLVESYVDFGGALVKNVNDVKPEVVPMQSIVFCDQTDIMSGPIAIKHYLSPDQLLAMADRGWGKEENGANCTLEEAITLSRSVRKDDKTLNDTPGRYIEVYEVHGNMPKRFREPGADQNTYETQLFIGCFYQKADGTQGNIKLFHMPEKKSPFKFISRDAIYGRALGFGGAEELFEAQVWTNYDMIRIQDMLDSASKTILKATGSTSATIANKNNVRNMDNLSIVDVGPDGDLGQVDTFPRNMKLFENSVQQWEAHAQQMGAANDSIMGESPNAGTPFKLQELVTQEAHSLHEYRKGKIATFLEEIYREWIIPHIIKELSKDHKFFAELDLEELQFVVERTVANAAFQQETETVLSGGDIDPQATEQLKEQIKEQIRKKGNRQFIELFKTDAKGKELSVRVNIVGKQKNLAGIVDKLTNIFRFAFSNPQGFAQVMQIGGMAKSFNQILEFSGLSPVDFSGMEELSEKMAAQAAPQQPPQAPMMSPVAA